MTWPEHLHSLADQLAWRTARQLDALIPDEPEPTALSPAAVVSALDAANAAVAPLIGRDGRLVDPYVSWEHALFLYHLSRALRVAGDTRLATRVFLLNKALHGIDLFHEVDMPRRFLIGHTVGMVFAKAEYGEWCIFHQGCTVGRILSDRPVLEEGIVLYANASVIGRCRVRRNTVVSAGVQLVNTDTPGNCIVFAGMDGRPIFKPTTEIFAHRYYDAGATGLTLA